MFDEILLIIKIYLIYLIQPKLIDYDPRFYNKNQRLHTYMINIFKNIKLTVKHKLAPLSKYE